MAAILDEKNREQAAPAAPKKEIPYVSRARDVSPYAHSIPTKLVDGRAGEAIQDMKSMLPWSSPKASAPEQPAHAPSVAPAPGPVSSMGASGSWGDPAPTTNTPPTQPVVGKPIVTNPWSGAKRSDTPFSNMGNGLYATGQGSGASIGDYASAHGLGKYAGPQQANPNAMYQWSASDGKNIHTVMLPGGMSPANMSPEELAKYSPQMSPMNDTGRDVTVIRGMREFKGGKEKVDDMTAERRTRQNDERIISSLAGAAARGADQGAVAGVMAQADRSAADIQAANIAAGASDRKAAADMVGASMQHAKTGTFRLANKEITGEDSLSMDYVWFGPGNVDYSSPSLGVLRVRNGELVLPDGVDPKSEKAKRYNAIVDALQAEMLRKLTPKE